MIYLFLIVILLFLYIVSRKKYSFENELQKCESPIEKMLIQKLYEKGYKPYSQVPCGKYRIDIGIYKKGKKIAIECDGEAYHTSKEQVEHDRRKDVFLKKRNWKIFRFTGKEIYNEVNWCVKMLEKKA